jgi:uncharacterized membrane protein
MDAFHCERGKMVVDIGLVIVFLTLGGLLALFVEAQKKLYHIYIAILLLLGATLLGVVEKAIACIAK